MLRLGVACTLAILAGGMTAAADDAQAPGSGPSRFDYLVLASVADATRPVSLALYRSAPQK